uniref:Uncharacterized protein n=1 Tax=Xiphophorus couchianus TaxID=32473 RepID=A0A3B5KQ01_9TELE
MCITIANGNLKTLSNKLHFFPQMERNETKCDYCGVSYLTLYENHQLQSQLAQLEAELQEWKETAQREKAQLEARELNRLEQERELQAQAEVREKTTRKELEKSVRLQYVWQGLGFKENHLFHNISFLFTFFYNYH